MSTIFKCKMCGGDLDVSENEKVAKCPYCGATQTLPNTNDEVITNLYNRANNLRLKCEFDKAEQMYDKIIELDDTQSEAHWGIVLCKYGIEYIEDPKTFNRVPTCHRTLFEAVLSDVDYQAAVENADITQKAIYELEARQIDDIQKNILTVVKNEKPFDVFICYKETDENGKRTIDSTIANDIYYQLSQEGFKVFYAAITLEDKLGQEYEPYIFAALNSAKVMLVLGTKPEYFTAVWVKNEWSRYLKLMKTNRDKLLIPCYRDMDAYELPEEFAHLQAQDMSKIGFINDVVRGIRKVVSSSDDANTNSAVASDSSQNIAPLLERAFMFLEDGEWNNANEYCERVLDQDPKNAQAYVGKLLADLRIKSIDGLEKSEVSFKNNSNYQKALRFADNDLVSTLQSCLSKSEEYINEVIIKQKEEEERLNRQYKEAIDTMAKSETPEEYEYAAKLFREISNFRDSEDNAKKCISVANKIRNYGKVFIHVKNGITENNFSIKIDNATLHNGSISSSGKQIEKVIPAGKHKLSIAGAMYFNTIDFDVESRATTEIEIKNSFAKYKVRVVRITKNNK